MFKKCFQSSRAPKSHFRRILSYKVYHRRPLASSLTYLKQHTKEQKPSPRMILAARWQFQKFPQLTDLRLQHRKYRTVSAQTLEMILLQRRYINMYKSENQYMFIYIHVYQNMQSALKGHRRKFFVQSSCSLSDIF